MYLDEVDVESRPEMSLGQVLQTYVKAVLLKEMGGGGACDQRIRGLIRIHILIT
jgi:hypothetical protein